MQFTYKYRLYPTKAQAAFLDGQLREACDLYNCALQERRDAWKTCRKSISYYDQSYQLKPMRAEGLIGLANFSCCLNVLRRLDGAFSSFFARVKRGEKPGYPRFKSLQRYNSITFPFYGDGCKLLDNDKVRIQGAGKIKTKLHRPIEGTIKYANIKRQANRWYVCFGVERQPKPLPHTAATIGIDLGLTSFAALSNGTAIENPKCRRRAQKKLRVAGRKKSRRKKGSNRYRKALILLQRAHAHVANQRRDFHHKESRKLVNVYGTIVVEDLNVGGLIRGTQSGLILDAGWSAFVNMLAYKAESAGRKLIKVNPRGTSQTCVCGASVPKTLKQRWHQCPACGLSVDRDVISAQVILSRAGSQPSGANVEEVVSCVS